MSASYVNPARIGAAIWYFVAGLLAFAIGIFAALAAAGGSTVADAAAAAFLALGVAIIAVGFWIRLFGLLERRLIDIQETMREAIKALETPASPKIDMQAPASSPMRPWPRDKI